MMKSEYLDILNKLQKKAPLDRNSKVLLVDCMNMFIRGFAMVPAINHKGQPIGGLIGFLRSLNYVVRTTSPTRVILVFDGIGAKTNKQNIDTQYKATRGLTRITNWEFYENRDQEHASFSSQMDRLIDYLHQLPLDMLSIDKQEADDIIAYLANTLTAQGGKSVIVSSDKDYLQLVSDSVEVYSPIKKKQYDTALFQEEFGIHPANYVYYKALIGDTSDNLPGVKGVGAKSIIKMFPAFVEGPVEDGLSYVFEECERNVEGKKKLYATILERAQRVQTNYQIMDLHNIELLPNDEEEVLRVLHNNKNTLNVHAFLRMAEVDHLDGHFTKNMEGWLETFRPLTQIQ